MFSAGVALLEIHPLWYRGLVTAFWATASFLCGLGADVEGASSDCATFPFSFSSSALVSAMEVVSVESQALDEVAASNTLEAFAFFVHIDPLIQLR